MENEKIFDFLDKLKEKVISAHEANEQVKCEEISDDSTTSKRMAFGNRVGVAYAVTFGTSKPLQFGRKAPDKWYNFDETKPPSEKVVLTWDGIDLRLAKYFQDDQGGTWHGIDQDLIDIAPSHWCEVSPPKI